MSSPALRALQVGALLVAGWALGRAPQLVDSARAALAPPVAPKAPVPPSAPPPTPGLTEAQAAELAGRVASQVAAETVARLVAAGWGPAGAPRTLTEPRVMVVRVPTEAPPAPPAAQPLANLSFDLPPGLTRRPSPEPARSTAKTMPAAAPDQQAFERASDAYSALRRGERRRAAEELAQAIALAPDAPQAKNWRADLRRLTARLRFDGFLVVRDDAAPSPAASPVLGGGQLGYALSFTPSPLSRAPVEIFARSAVPYASSGRVVTRYSQGAAGVRWRFLPGLAVDVERQIGFGFAARDDWAARLSGGTQGRGEALGRDWQWDGYGEAGVVGTARTDWYGGIQGRIGTPLAGRDSVLLLGGGIWASAQGGYGAEVSRLDVGPSLRLLPRRWPVQGQIDYRLQAAGNARPGSGPVLTITAGF